MTLPGFVKRFWYASLQLGARFQRTPWGAVATDPRYPLVWDANTAVVLDPVPGLDAATIRRVLYPALLSAGATVEHVEFWETSSSIPALDELRRAGEIPDPDIVMVLEEAASPASSSVRTQEVTRPDASFWGWYRDSLREFETPMADDVLDQMVDRTREVSLPAGQRWFVGWVDDRPAGYASLLSLEGVGYIEQVVTMPRYRRRGVASVAVLRAVAASASHGDGHVFLLTQGTGAPRRLYERLGFRERAGIQSFTAPIASGARR